ncbi:DUF397 domain-containing protein [Saccharopolyspora taberi]|uniref:DUF397 domain-containing protein n=1 Tax=Saccharopolyspora taberi TaxID=60895 RepID=A0ABN3VGN5_9PSEU
MRWRRPSRSGGNGGQCVEVALTPDAVGVRDSKDPAGGTLRVRPEAWAGFVAAIRAGRFGR